jgi:biopolymer transport protein ExbD
MSRVTLLVVGAAVIAAAQTLPLRQGVSVQMPVTSNAAPMPDADRAESLVVTLTLTGDTYLDVTAVTPAQLTARVTAELEAHAGKRLYFRVDARTPYSTVEGVLKTIRAAGVGAPILLTSRRDLTGASYMPPHGLEVRLPPAAPDTARSTTIRVGHGHPSDSELSQSVRRDIPVVLEVDANTPFRDVVHVVDLCHGAEVTVFLVP